ncbi:metallophosphoesterase [Acidithiobacillus ferrooxidans]|nr:metallophosphoesterase [Acidithiobacillus ferrooxidans]
MTAFLQDNPLVIHHASNPDGRDFVVGDLHGCRAMLDTMMTHVGFDPAKDRLFSVGDLVDRGPDSVGCLELLLEPWFFPVLGNHDAMLLAYWSTGSGERQNIYRDAFQYNGGTIWAYPVRDLADQFVPLLENLPFVRVVGDGEHRFQVLHAERRDNDTAPFFPIPIWMIRDRKSGTTIILSGASTMLATGAIICFGDAALSRPVNRSCSNA